ncbi:alpha/beta hydrolase [Patescibacteria group bacterium]|nr:alpha/beta hydrolase [Patescibacteria group bacterium]
MTEKETIINNFKIKYSERRENDGVVFVFLHGWGSSKKIFSPVYKNLDNYLSFDFPGFGGSSDLKKPLTLLDYAEIVNTIINTRLSDEKIIFVAHSFGGRVLLKLLTEYNIKNIEGVICIGVPFVRNRSYRNKIINIVTKFFGFIFSFLPRFLSNSTKKFWYKIIGANDYLGLENDAMRKTFINIINEDIFKMSDVLRKYKTSFVWGSDDREAPLNSAEVVSQNVEAKLYIIKNGGHFPFIGDTANEFIKIFKQITKI